MTEDDTARILARPNIHKMVELYQSHKTSLWTRETYSYSSLDNLKFAKKHGWGWRQFLIEKKKAGYS